MYVLPHFLSFLSLCLSPVLYVAVGSRLPELGPAAAHDLVLAHQLGTEFTSIQSKVNVEVDAVEDTLRGVHALEVRLEVLAREVRRERDNFLDAWKELVSIHNNQR